MRAFRDLPRSRPPSWPRYFLLCHAVELAIKAHLVLGWTLGEPQTGAEEKRRNKLRLCHDIKELLVEAFKLGLELNPSVRDKIKLLNAVHANYWHRYPQEAGHPVVVIEHIEPYANELLAAVSAGVRPRVP